MFATGLTCSNEQLIMDEEISAMSKRIADGIQILAPGCAVAPGTPTENLVAMVEVAKVH